MTGEGGSNDNAKLGLAGLAIVIALGAQAVAFVFFLEDGAKVASFNISGGNEYVGWMSQITAFFFGTLSMFLILRPSDDEDEE